MAKIYSGLSGVTSDLEKVLLGILVDLTAIKTSVDTSNTEVTELKLDFNRMVTDMGSRITENNTLATKLNADAGVTDADYAAATAITATVIAAANPTAVGTLVTT